MSIADFIGSLCFVGFFIMYKLKSNKTVAENFKNNVTAGDYAVEIKGVPQNCEDENHIQAHFQRFGEVIEVYFARNYRGMLSLYKERAKLSTKLGYQRILAEKHQNNEKNVRKISKLEEKIRIFDTKMHIRLEKENRHDKLPVNRAYLIFNKLENKKKCLEVCRFSKKMCKNTPVPIELIYNGEHELKVKQTTEPSNIL